MAQSGVDMRGEMKTKIKIWYAYHHDDAGVFQIETHLRFDEFIRKVVSDGGLLHQDDDNPTTFFTPLHRINHIEEVE